MPPWLPGLHYMLQFGVVPYTSWICCCTPLITTKRTFTEGRPVFLGLGGRFLEHQNLPMLKFLTDSRCLRMTLHLLCFTWFYYSKSTSSQVFGKKHPLLNVKETLPLCLWMNEPCSSFTTNQSSFLFSSSWSGGLFLGNLHLHDFFRLKCQTWLEVQMVHYGYGLSFFLTLKSWTHQDFEP